MRVALRDALQSAGYRVMEASHGEEGLARVREERPDLVLLDVMMPRLDGFALCAELRRIGVTSPVLMLTAKGRVEDRVEGLDSGADDYLVKPFSLDELLARVRALLRRADPGAVGFLPDILELGQVRLDLRGLAATRAGKTLHLTPKEWAILELLVRSSGAVVTRERFLDVVWGYAAFPTTRTVDTHVASLRAKIENDPESPRYILTVHGVGYRLAIVAGG